MRWLCAGLAFAAVVGLAVATAAMRVDSVASRGRLQVLVERIEAARVRLAAERAAGAEIARPEVLVARWQQLVAARSDGGDRREGL